MSAFDTSFVAISGAIGDGSADDTAALQAAINSAQAAGKGLSLTRGARYRTTAPLVIEQGGSTQKRFILEGNGATLLPAHAGFTVEVRPLGLKSAQGGASTSGSIQIRRLSILGDLQVAGTSGIRVGRPGFSMYDWGRTALLEDVRVFELSGIGLYIENASHFDIVRYTHRSHNGGRGLFLASQDGSFTGDMTFNDCQFQGTKNSPPFRLVSYDATGTFSSQLRGIRFQSCVVYGAGSRVDAAAGGVTGDVWFSDCAWDGPPSNDGNALELYSSGEGKLTKIYVDNPYIVNYTGIGIWLRRDGSGDMREIKITNGAISQVAEPVKAINSMGFDVSGVTFHQNSPWAAINIDVGCSEFVLQNNREHLSTSTFFIACGGSSRFVIKDNVSFSASAGVVFDYSGAVPKDVSGNARL